jgi:hypothetical protein
MLNGTVNPEGSPGTVVFQFTTDSTFNTGINYTPSLYNPITLTANNTTQAISANTNQAIELSSGTTYYYRSVFSNNNNGETKNGPTQSFTTPTTPVTTGAATTITSSSAMLNGTVNPEGSPGTVVFQFTTDSTLNTGINYTPSLYNPITLTANNTTQSISASTNQAEELSSGTTYYYRTVFSNNNNGETKYGPVQQFNTFITTPTVTVTPSAFTLTAAQALTVTASVSGGTGNPTPTGSVTLSSGAYKSSPVALTGGTAMINVQGGSLAVGSDSVTVTYSGDTNYSSGLGTASVTVTAASTGVLTSPVPGTVLPGSTVTFTWTTVAGATSYDLWLGTSGPGSSSLYASGLTTANSVTVTSLPARGATLYARLFSMIGGKSQYNDYIYTEAGTAAAMTSPAPGKTLGTSGVTFTWTAGYGVTEYNLWLGTTGAGSSSLYNSGWVTATSATVAGVPAKGATVYARLYSMVEGVEHYNDYTYTETEAGTRATMMSPTDLSTLGTSNVMFTWTAGTGATQYNLWLGLSGPGSSSLYASGWSAALAATVPSLPAKGATVYARLYSDVNGVTEYNDYTYTEQ